MEFLLSFIGQEEAKTSIRHDADANENACFGCDTLVPPEVCSEKLNWVDSVYTYCQTDIVEKRWGVMRLCRKLGGKRTNLARQDGHFSASAPKLDA